MQKPRAYPRQAFEAACPAQGFVNLAEAAGDRSTPGRMDAPARPLRLCLSLPFMICKPRSSAACSRLRSHFRVASTIEVGVPATFAHREARWTIVSLTRSHGQRATALGASPKELLLALTRSAKESSCLAIRAMCAACKECSLGGGGRPQAAHERSLLNTLATCCRLLESRPVVSVGSEGQAP